jgi:hypothetical protein
MKLLGDPLFAFVWLYFPDSGKQAESLLAMSILGIVPANAWPDGYVARLESNKTSYWPSPRRDDYVFVGRFAQ